MGSPTIMRGGKSYTFLVNTVAMRCFPIHRGRRSASLQDLLFWLSACARLERKLGKLVMTAGILMDVRSKLDPVMYAEEWGSNALKRRQRRRYGELVERWVERLYSSKRGK